MSNAKVKEFVERMTASRKRFEEEARPIIHDFIKGFFIDHPEVKIIKWDQYIQSFNDGDPCTFSLGEIVMVIDGLEIEDSEYEFDYEGGTYQGASDYTDGVYETPKRAWFQEFESFLNEMDDFVQDLYGDNATVYCTPEKITTEEYYCGY